MDLTIAYVAALTLIASLLGTVTAFGISTFMVPLMLFFYPLPETLLFVGIIHWFNDNWKLILFRRGMRWRLLLAFGLPGVVASFLGASLSLGVSREVLSRVLGLFLILYVLSIRMKPAFRLSRTLPTALVGGASYGFIAGIFGIGGEVRGAFLAAYDLEKEVYIATSGAIALIVDSVRISTYLLGGTRLDPVFLWGLMIFVPVSFLGALMGKRIVNKIPQDKFRAVVSAFLLIVGMKLFLIP